MITLKFLVLFIVAPTFEVLSQERSNVSQIVVEWRDVVSHSYLNYEDTIILFQEMQDNYPDLVSVYSIGKSAEGREMWVINLRTNVTSERKLLQPPVKIVANWHGDESVGRTLVLMLAVDLIARYESGDKRTLQLLDTTDIHLLPSINPDGFEKALNCFLDGPGKSCKDVGFQHSNFPTIHHHVMESLIQKRNHWVMEWEKHDYTFHGELYFPPPEIENMIISIFSGDFVLSANLKGRNLVVKYPFSEVRPEIESQDFYYSGYGPLPVKASWPFGDRYRGWGVSHPTPDNEVFVYLAKTYASSNHRIMTNKEFRCGKPRDFLISDGIVNGALHGNNYHPMQDFNYVYSNCFEIDAYVSCEAFPDPVNLPFEWDSNKESLYKFMEAAHMGIRGVVTDSKGQPAEGVFIDVEGIEYSVKTNKRGEYWRLLVPGTYQVSARVNMSWPSWNILDDYERTKWKEVHVGELLVGSPKVVDFQLPAPGTGIGVKKSWFWDLDWMSTIVCVSFFGFIFVCVAWSVVLCIMQVLLCIMQFLFASCLRLYLGRWRYWELMLSNNNDTFTCVYKVFTERLRPASPEDPEAIQ